MYYSNPASSLGGLFWLIVIISIVIGLIAAAFMANAAADKGYGPEAHIMAICFWLGIFGYLYTICLPDKKLQNQNDRILRALEKQQQSVYSDELPDL